MASLFERLNEGRQPQQRSRPKRPTERRPRNAGFVAQGEKDTKIKAFLLDILAKGPVPATTIQKRGVAAGVYQKTTLARQGADRDYFFQKRTRVRGPLALGSRTA